MFKRQAHNGAFVDQIKGFNDVLAALNTSSASSSSKKEKSKKRKRKDLADKKATSGLAYNKILKNKDVSKYSAKDLSEIFGGVSTALPGPEPVNRPRTRSWSASQEALLAEAGQASKKQKKAKKAKKAKKSKKAKKDKK